MSALLTAADTRATASEAMTVAAQASLVDAEQSVVRLKEKLELAFTERSQVAEQHRQYVLPSCARTGVAPSPPPAASELIRLCGVACAQGEAEDGGGTCCGHQHGGPCAGQSQCAICSRFR